MPNGYDQIAEARPRRGRMSVAEASGSKRSDGQSSQDRSGANRYDTSTPEGRRKALAAARKSDNPADEAKVRRQINQEANSTIDALMLGLNMDGKPMARRDNRATRQGGFRVPAGIAVEAAMFANQEECGDDGFVDGFVLGKASSQHGGGDWDHEGPDGPMREAKGDKKLPPWLQKDGEDSGSGSDSEDSGSRRRRRRGKVAESALNPQIRFRETVNNNGFEEAKDGKNLPPWLRKDDEDDDSDDMDEAELNADKRNDLPGTAFAGPDRTYPIDTEARARSAIARVKANGSPALQRRVIAAVKRRYPDMDVEATAGKSSS